MNKAAHSIERGLRQAIAHATGRRTGGRKKRKPKERALKTEAHGASRRRARPAIVHEVRVGEPDVAAIRARTGLSQAAFAKSIGVAKGTLLNWEQRRRMPEGPARVLLALIDKDPNIVQRALARR